MANKKISELTSRTPSLTDLILVGDPSSGYSYKATVSALATIIETDISDGYVTLGTTQTISGAKTFSNVLTLTSVANANTDTDKFLVLNASNGVNYRTGAEVLSDIGGQGALSLAAIGSTPNANGATLSSNTLNLQPASGSFGGVVTTGFQEFAGQKRFLDNPIQFDKHLEVKNINTSGVSWGYTSFASKDTPAFGFLRGHSFTPTPTSYYAWFNYGTTGIREYTLPSSDGTLALTSDITGAVSGTTNYISKFTSSTAIGNSVIYESSGNIGIGTTSPASVSGYTTLSLNNAVAGGNLVFQLNGSDKGSIYNSSSDLVIKVNSGATIFENSGSEKMRLTSGGNLGIGRTPYTWSNGTSIDIQGTNYSLISLNSSNGSSRNWAIASNYNAWGDLVFLNGTSNAAQPSSIKMTLDISGNLGLGVTPSAWSLAGLNVMQIKNGFIYGYSNETSYGVNAYYNGSSWTYIASAEATRYGQNSGVHAWYNAPSGTAGNAITFTQAMTLDASGRLGIGTTSPAVKLHIVGGTETVRVESNNATGGSYMLYKNSSGNLGYIGWGSSSNNILNIANEQNADITILTNSSERMRITSGGNVGIGTSSPSNLLSISSTANNTSQIDLSGFLGDTKGHIGSYARSFYLSTNWYYNGSQNADNTGYGQAAVELSGSEGAAIFLTSAAGSTVPSERMRITSGGEVYIAGTTDQGAYNLQVNGTGVWGAGAYVNGSDSSLKENIQNMGSALSLINQMQPKTFTYKSSYSKDKNIQVGFIAQDLEQVLSNQNYKSSIVVDGPNFKSVAYQNLIPLLVQSIKELKAEIETIKNK